MIRIPVDSLSPQALEGLVDAFVLREGTEYGAEDFSLAQKREQVIAQLLDGSAIVVFDPETESPDIRRADDLDTG